MPEVSSVSELHEYLKSCKDPDFHGSEECGCVLKTVVSESKGIKSFTNSFWTKKQRQASSIHEISYRACFKPQLPRFFIELLTDENDIVYDPFTGRGTTAIEAGLLGREVVSNDINPLSGILCRPRLLVPEYGDIERRLSCIESERADIKTHTLSMFYHPDTEAEIVSLRNYLERRRASGTEDICDKWIRMVATNRLTGHSPGFFSVYTLPPNQAVSKERQVKINAQRKQTPEYRNTTELILKKTRRLLKNVNENELKKLRKSGENAVFLTNNATKTSGIPDSSVSLTVTSPPFLDIVRYDNDNWLRCWFNSLDAEEIRKSITMSPTLKGWCKVMGEVFNELYRITKPGGWVAFEVGEIRKGSLNLDEHVFPLGINAGFECAGTLINEQNFTKTSNIWGISNKKRGTNTNRVVIFQKN
ncbi:DNA modification methylase [Methanomicrobium sp. W14]|uniref:DNA methyltransferase n=1 Tax=Methanomicrobium sp. W14 TaxID=2817839 RepID=UPI001AE3E727|nr:DNA methyltransferase [Methanomicrobium sp. W14]MBP2133532.1 DNA modification methylase [Methanomicrobium sp. W14]